MTETPVRSLFILLVVALVLEGSVLVLALPSVSDALDDGRLRWCGGGWADGWPRSEPAKLHNATLSRHTRPW